MKNKDHCKVMSVNECDNMARYITAKDYNCHSLHVTAVELSLFNRYKNYFQQCLVATVVKSNGFCKHS